ncbi:hypothetical protein [Brevibacillus fortis]|uniref:hypothetical protein n=1 Tax=Brevibacillus fortis TaxID=2126352 RepID=UPI0038FD156E
MKAGKLVFNTRADWEKNLYEAIGNGVPVYMAMAFGEVYKPAVAKIAVFNKMLII